MPLRTLLLQPDRKPLRRFFACVPEAHILYVVPPACCRCRWFEHEIFDGPGRISFLYLDDTDIALGNFTLQIAQALQRILPRLGSRPKALQICFTCAFEVLGVDYSTMVEELEDEFPGIRFYTFPIHHLTTHDAIRPPEHRELSLYQALRDPLPTDPTAVNVVDFTISTSSQNELLTALRDCGITTLRQPVLMSTYEEFCQVTASCLNLRIGRCGVPACEFLERTFGIPTLHAPETYSPLRIQDSVTRVYEHFGRQPRSMTAQVDAAMEQGRRVAALFDGRPLGILEANTIDSVDLALSLQEMGFNVELVNCIQPTAYQLQLFDQLREQSPTVRMVDTHEQSGIQVAPETVLMGSPLAAIEGGSLFFRARSHGDDYGLARTEHLLRDLESFARREL
ncbi:MAG: nitrogenase component 1 [Coriobacteriia bacterium]|nr:nitrogenase component 1 [Coriobacteriia bacterium]